MPFSIERNDLASVSADVIIVAANEDLQITGGVGKAVAQVAGFEKSARGVQCNRTLFHRQRCCDSCL